MTTLLLLLLCSGLVIFFLLYHYFKLQQHFSETKDKIETNRSELNRISQSERRLKEENKILQTKLSHTFEDPVTRLLGWQLFEDRLNQNIKESERYHLTLGVLFVDVDDFKVINDAFSYEVGDLVLKEVAKRLQSCIRQVDSLARFSKDTFVVLLSQLGKPEAAAVVAQRMLQTVKEPFFVKEKELYITISIGISIFPTDGQTSSELLRSADHALHLAKEKGKHTYQFYQERMHIESQRELALNTSLSRETIFQEFIIYYQPIVNTQNESVFCIDALLHWQHPQFGLINPHELFIYAEKQHKLHAISEWLLKNAAKQFLHWRSLGFAPECIGIPLSIRQLESSHFIYRISQILQELGFHPEMLLLEIKTGSALLSFEILEKAFNMLKYVGVKIAIDDFGVDTFALSHLKNIGINYLKLDKSLVTNIDSASTTSLLKAIMYLTNSMSLQVIAQGVETEEQMRILKELGYMLMQGKLLGAPLLDREVINKMVEQTS